MDDEAVLSLLSSLSIEWSWSAARIREVLISNGRAGVSEKRIKRLKAEHNGVKDNSGLCNSDTSPRMDLLTATKSFKQLLASVNIEDRANFVTWLDEYLHEDLHKQRQKREEASTVMEEIKEVIRGELPVKAIYDTESIQFPSVGEDAILNDKNTVHLDAFLYDTEEEDRLVDEGQLTRSFCRSCGSRDTEQFTFVTHSCSQQQLELLFTEVLADLSGKTLVDVGSRTGVVLYAAHLLSTASRIIGVEVNPEFCQLQRRIVNQFHFCDRVTIDEGDAMKKKQVLSTADIVVLNNVFQWFLCPSEQAQAWTFLKRTVKKGARLVTGPTVRESLEHLDVDFSEQSWLELVNDGEVFESNDVTPLFVYEVK